MPQKKDPSTPVAIIAVALAVLLLIVVILWRDARKVEFVPRDAITTTTVVVTLPDGG